MVRLAYDRKVNLQPSIPGDRDMLATKLRQSPSVETFCHTARLRAQHFNRFVISDLSGNIACGMMLAKRAPDKPSIPTFRKAFL